jgi:hypothetical protein
MCSRGVPQSDFVGADDRNAGLNGITIGRIPHPDIFARSGDNRPRFELKKAFLATALTLRDSLHLDSTKI